MVIRSAALSALLVVSVVGCNDSSSFDVPAPKPMFSDSDIKKMQQAEEFAPKVTGSVHSVGGELGTWDVALTDCHSGERNGFYGVDMFAAGSDALRVRFVHDEAAGTIVKVAYPQHPTTVRVFNREDTCAVLEGSVEKMNGSTRVPGVGYRQHVAGHVKFDCADDDESGSGSAGSRKGRVTGELTFEHCH